MTIFDKIDQLQKQPTGRYGERVLMELRYALRLSQARDGAFDQLVHQVADFLLSRTADGFLSEATAKEAEEMLLPLEQEAKSYTLHCVSHAHIDMNWMWGYQETVNLTLDTFRTMLQLMEEYPSFTFSQSQASTYVIAEEYDPPLFARIAERIKEGRWEVIATTWTEADKNLPSGESLSRHILYTKAYMKEKFGLLSEDLQLDFEPDTFGHSRRVPEILANGDVKYYYHCRGDLTQAAYRYKAPSGKEVLCYQDPYWYNGQVNELWFEFLPLLYKERGIRVGLRVYGVGDHGGGPSRRDIERLIDMQTWPIAPQILFSSYHAFFRQLETYRDTLPVIEAERNYTFTGCYSSQSRIKAANRTAEDRLFDAEALSAFAFCHAGETSYAQQFQKAWRRVLFNQFHDILPGSCMPDSRDHALGEIQNALGFAGCGITRAMLRLSEAIDTSSIAPDNDPLTVAEGAGVGFGSELLGRSVNAPAEHGRGKVRVLHIFNPSPIWRREAMEVILWDYTGDPSLLEITDPDGKVLRAVVIEQGGYWLHTFVKLLVFVEVAPFGYSTYIAREGERQELSLKYTPDPRLEQFPDNTLENSRIKAVFDKNMRLTALMDKATGRQMISDPSCTLWYFEESTRHERLPSAWAEGDEVFGCCLNEAGKVYVTRREKQEGLRQRIFYTIEFRKTTVNAVVSLDEDAALLRFHLDTDWQENGLQGGVVPAMRFELPFAYTAEDYLYDIPAGTIRRSDVNHAAPGRNFVYAIPQNGGTGLGLFTDTIHAYRGENNRMTATILRATCHPDPYPEFGAHANDIGVALLPADNVAIEETAMRFTHPLRYLSMFPHKGTLPLSGSFLTADGPAVFSAIKTPEETDGAEMVIRLYNPWDDRPADTRLTFSQPVREAHLADILERPQEALLADGRELTVPVGPGALVTVRVRL